MSDQGSWNALLSHPMSGAGCEISGKGRMSLGQNSGCGISGEDGTSQGWPSACAWCRDPFGATPSGFPKRTRGVLPYPDSLREKHPVLANITHPDDSISYSDMLSRSLTKVHKPCYDIPTACPYSLHSVFGYGKGLQSFGSSCFWAFHCFAMDSKELSSILDCFGDQITNKKHQNLHNLIRNDCKGP